MRPQVYISSDFGATFTQANSNGGADRSWAAVFYSRDGSTLVAAAGSSVELRRAAAKALGSRVANRAEQQMQQSRRSAKPAETDQADTVWSAGTKAAPGRQLHKIGTRRVTSWTLPCQQMEQRWWLFKGALLAATRLASMKQMYLLHLRTCEM